MPFKDLLNSIFVSNEEISNTLEMDQTIPTQNLNVAETKSEEGGSHLAGNDRKSNVISINESRKMAVTVQICVPRIYGEAERIGQQLLDGKGLVLNFSRMSDVDARRFIDYLAGIVYAINGDMQRVGTDIFLAVPGNVEIEGLFEELDDNRKSSLDSTSIWQRKKKED